MPRLEINENDFFFGPISLSCKSGGFSCITSFPRHVFWHEEAKLGRGLGGNEEIIKGGGVDKRENIVKR